MDYYLASLWSKRFREFLNCSDKFSDLLHPSNMEVFLKRQGRSSLCIIHKLEQYKDRSSSIVPIQNSIWAQKLRHTDYRQKILLCLLLTLYVFNKNGSSILSSLFFQTCNFFLFMIMIQMMRFAKKSVTNYHFKHLIYFW